MQKICPRCGKPTEKFYEGLCLRCYLETKKIIPPSIEIKQCDVCGNYFFGGKRFKTVEGAVEFALRKLLKNLPVEASFRISSEGLFLTLDDIEFHIPLQYRNFICPSCRKTTAVQAVIQIRGSEEFTSKLLNTISREIDSSRDRTLKIVKIERQKTGLDLHVSSKKGIRRIIKSLREKYKLSVKTTRKLVGLKEGSRVYKDFVSVKEWEKSRK